MSRMLGHETAAWRKESRKQLREHPRCERCGGKATLAHHVDGDGPLGGGPLKSLCDGCHAQEHAQERGRSRGVKPE